MRKRLSDKIRYLFALCAAVVLLSSSGCHPTRHVGQNQYLVRKNTVVLNSEYKLAAKGEMKDNLGKMVVQKPNTTPLWLPIKLGRYNRRYKKLHDRPIDSLPKSVEPPVIYDSVLTQRSVQNMRNFLFNQGYFYPKIKDTVVFRHRRAYTTYTVNTGINYLINKVNYYIEDSNIARIVRAAADRTVLQKGLEFKHPMLEEERSRITALVRNNGYYKFTQENVHFIDGIDTVDKTTFRNAESIFEGIVNFALSVKQKKRPTADIDIHIVHSNDTNCFTRYSISKVTVYPDYTGPADRKDSTLIVKKISTTEFKYHNYYVHPHVLYEHIFLTPGYYFSQADYDKTLTKLSELSIAKYVRVLPVENRRVKGSIDFDIVMQRHKKHDFFADYQLSSGTTYFLGHSLSLNFRARNLLKGANVITVGVNGGVEYSYNDKIGKDVRDHLSLLTRYYGVNASIDFPKFLAPIASSLFNNTNVPHTVVGGGENVMERVSYFTLVNTSANFTYNWRQTKNTTWAFAPGFVNIIRLPVKTDSFKSVLSHNAYLQNSYKENFIEGETISFTYDDMNSRRGRNYSYIKLSMEEAGEILSGFNKLGTTLNDLYKIDFAQYTKFDFDGRHYFTFPHSVVAMRFAGGIGTPYGQSNALPYIKQYFAGGPYSLRGWRVRTLGPGSFHDSANASNSNVIDRTGDIKLEFNTEFRFPIAPLFAGAIKMNGALFMDAGNIWLAQSDPSYPGGDFSFNNFGKDIAADIGAGTRFDIASFLTLRVDMAIPVKEPYLSKNGGWVMKGIDFYDSAWRASNLVFNISIGYPF